MGIRDFLVRRPGFAFSFTAVFVLGLGFCVTGFCSAAGVAAQEKGFVRIFNGKDLSEWDGDPRLWSVEDGAIVGQTTKEKRARGNTFCIWNGGKLENFILKVKFRIFNGNSGIQYRSKKPGKWRVGGYQAEVDNQLGDVGELYDERGRGHLARVGQFSKVKDGGKRTIIGEVSSVKSLKNAEYYKPRRWNEYTIVARGNHLMQFVNGYQTIEVIDNDRKNRDMEGILAFQIHAGPPMRVQYKDIRVKTLKGDYGEAIRLFNGTDLSGWTFSSSELEDTWTVKDGRMINSGSPPGYIRTKKSYTNFALHFQVRHITEGNGGVLLRVVGPDKVWPRSIEAQGQYSNMGDIWNIGDFPMNTGKSRTKGRRTVKLHDSNERGLGRWNDYDVILNGGELSIYINRLLQNKAADCAELAGKIALQSEGAKMEYRNIVLVPIGK